MAQILTSNSLTSTFLVSADRVAWRNLDTLYQQAFHRQTLFARPINTSRFLIYLKANRQLRDKWIFYVLLLDDLDFLIVTLNCAKFCFKYKKWEEMKNVEIFENVTAKRTFASNGFFSGKNYLQSSRYKNQECNHCLFLFSSFLPSRSFFLFFFLL